MNQDRERALVRKAALAVVCLAAAGLCVLGAVIWAVAAELNEALAWAARAMMGG